MFKRFKLFVLLYCLCLAFPANAIETIRYYFNAIDHSQKSIACYVEFADNEGCYSFTLHDSKGRQLGKLDCITIEEINNTTYIGIPLNFHIYDGNFEVLTEER